MKSFLLAIGILGLAACIGLCETLPACTEPITSSNVQLISEQLPSGGQSVGRTKNGTNAGPGRRAGYRGGRG